MLTHALHHVTLSLQSHQDFGCSIHRPCRAADHPAGARVRRGELTMGRYWACPHVWVAALARRARGRLAGTAAFAAARVYPLCTRLLECGLALSPLTLVVSRVVQGVGAAMQEHLRTELVLGALEMAVGKRQPEAVLMHHSDHGSQYTALVCGERCRSVGIRPSMGTSGDCYDNALMESFSRPWSMHCWRSSASAPTRCRVRQPVHETGVTPLLSMQLSGTQVCRWLAAAHCSPCLTLPSAIRCCRTGLQKRSDKGVHHAFERRALGLEECGDKEGMALQLHHPHLVLAIHASYVQITRLQYRMVVGTHPIVTVELLCRLRLAIDGGDARPSLKVDDALRPLRK